MKSKLLFLLFAISLATTVHAAGPVYAPTPADYVIPDFKFRSGERLPALRIHYATLGQPHRNAKGRIDNAVLLLHGTGGDGRQFLRAQFADELFGSGQPLDLASHYIILIDDIGHGASSKPSDGLHAQFPHYDYADMVEAEHRLTAEHLGVARLRLVLGTSMGCMHAFLWGETFPDGADALMPLACLPSPIAGRNRLWRKMLIDAVKKDPAWQGGEYKTPPVQGLRTAADLLALAGSAPLQNQKQWPMRDAADGYVEAMDSAIASGPDANDLIYQVASSGDYDPSGGLEKITTPLAWVNSADDFINPPELGIAEKMAPRIAKGRFVLLPISDKTHGHSTHTWAAAWKDVLVDLLKRSEPTS